MASRKSRALRDFVEALREVFGLDPLYGERRKLSDAERFNAPTHAFPGEQRAR